MKPRISVQLLESLKKTGTPPPWRCKIELPERRTIYGCEITSDGEIARVGQRGIYSEAELGFKSNAIEKVAAY